MTSPISRPARVGLITDQTGALSFMGIANVNLAKMVTDDINARGGLLGHPVELYVEDSATDDHVHRGPLPGLLRRPGALHRADRRGGAPLRQRPRLRPRLVRRRPPVAGRIEEALALTEESVAAARRFGNPYWVAYALWIAGMAFSRTNARRALAAWEEGIAFVREHRIHFFEGFIARDAARLNTSDGEPDMALGLFAEAIEAFHRAGNVPQLIITLASVPALFERLDRLEPAAMLLGAMSREASSFHHVPELAELRDRLTSRIGATKAGELIAAGAGLDLDAAAVYARRQIDAARRDPRPGPRGARPGGLSRREIDVLRLVAAGRTSGEIATELFISSRTAEHHIQNIYTKIGVSSRVAATRWAVKHQVVDGVGGR